MRNAIILGAAALALAGCTGDTRMGETSQARAQRDLAEALKGRVAGTPTDCISDTQVDGPQIIDERTLLYREGRRVWRAELASACPGLDPYDTVVVELHGSQLCRNDQFRAVSPGSHIPGPYCRFARFTPYTEAGR
jgi:hypothetical protein